jgi:protein-tyrosine phosphatase
MRSRGYDGSSHRARQFEREWLDSFNAVIALDTSHLRALQRIASDRQREKVRLLTSFDPEATTTDVPDPYYGSAQGFDDVLAMIERACRAMLADLRREIAA